MRNAVDAAVVFLLLVVGTWVALFGVTCAIVNRRRSRSPVSGALLGVVFGPFGLIWQWWALRRPAGIGDRVSGGTARTWGRVRHGGPWRSEGGDPAGPGGRRPGAAPPTDEDPL